MLKRKVDKLGPNTFEGRVICLMGRSRLWSESTGILRTTKKNAEEDARKLELDIRDKNRI